jgi:hypothetical protein
VGSLQRARRVLTSRRVFVGTTEVAGYFGNLQRGLEELGVRTTYLDLSGHPFDYRRPSAIGRWGRWTLKLAIRAAEGTGPMRRVWRSAWLLSYIAQMPVRIGLFASAVARHDAFILSSDTWVHRRFDLPLLRLFRKRVVVVFTGSDHRPPYLDGWFGARVATGDWAALARETRRVSERVHRAERYADEIVALPASSHFHTKPIVDFLRIGIPFDVGAEPTVDPRGPFRGEGVRALHSPSNVGGKGTELIRAAIAELRAAGHAIDYHEIHRRPHREVLDALRACDFVVDEVYSDTPMAAFATEAAALGKPAVVTGYYAELIGDQLPPDDIPPSLFDLPERLRPAIERMVTDEVFRRELGERARRFVHERWTPAEVASRYLRVLEGDVPDEWRWDPARQRYLYGWGRTAEGVAASVSGMVGHGGEQALRIAQRTEFHARLTAPREEVTTPGVPPAAHRDV